MASLFLWALLFASSLALADPPQKFVYVFSQPQEQTVELGKAWITAHYVGELGYKICSTAVCYFTAEYLSPGTGPAAAKGYAASNYLQSIPSIRVQTQSDLNLRYRVRVLKDFREVAQIPGISRVTMLTTSETQVCHLGLVAKQCDFSGYLFVEATEPIDPAKLPAGMTWNPKWGEPVLISDPSKAHIQFDLKGQETLQSWSPSIREVLDGKPIPESVQEDWKKALRARAKTIKLTKLESAYKGLTDPYRVKNLKIEASLVNENGSVRDLGKLSEGSGVLSFVGETHSQKLKSAAKTGLYYLSLAGEKIYDPGSETPYKRPTQPLPIKQSTLVDVAGNASAFDCLTAKLREVGGGTILIEEGKVKKGWVEHLIRFGDWLWW